MSNPFAVIASAFTWLGKEIVKVSDWLPKVVELVDDVEEDTETVIPELTTVVEDVDALALATVKDGGVALTATAALVAAVEAEATTAASGNIVAAIQNAPAVATAFEQWIAAVTSHGTYSDIITAEQKLVVDYDKFGASAKAAIQKLESDAS